MIIQSVHNSWDMFHNQYRNTVYKTIEDPATGKEKIEIVQFLYTKNGPEEYAAKGTNVDLQA